MELKCPWTDCELNEQGICEDEDFGVTGICPLCDEVVAE